MRFVSRFGVPFGFGLFTFVALSFADRQPRNNVDTPVEGYEMCARSRAVGLIVCPQNRVYVVSLSDLQYE